jgi:hypothetical protein
LIRLLKGRRGRRGLELVGAVWRVRR